MESKSLVFKYLNIRGRWQKKKSDGGRKGQKVNYGLFEIKRQVSDSHNQEFL